MASFMGIPVTYFSWEILFTMTIVFAVLMAVFIILGWVRSFQLGALLPNGILGIECFSGLVYNALWLKVKDKDVLESKDGEKKYYLRNGGTYKPTKTGPTIALLDAVSDYTINLKYANYIIKMKRGDNLTGIISAMTHKDKPSPDITQGIQFQSIQQAALWFNKNVYIPKMGRDPLWVNEETERMMKAEGVVISKMSERTESSSETDPATGKVRDSSSVTRTPVPTEGMDDHTFMAYMKELEARMVQLGAKVLPLNINGEVIDLHGIADWTFSPSPENTLDSQYKKGMMKGLSLSKNGIVDAMKYVLIIMAICIGPTMAYLILTHVH